MTTNLILIDLNLPQWSIFCLIASWTADHQSRVFYRLNKDKKYDELLKFYANLDFYNGYGHVDFQHQWRRWFLAMLPQVYNAWEELPDKELWALENQKVIQKLVEICNLASSSTYTISFNYELQLEVQQAARKLKHTLRPYYDPPPYL